MAADYDVVLLVEEGLSPGDARRVRSLHETVEEPVVYHLLMPLDDGAARIEASLGSLAGGEVGTTAAPALPPEDVAEVREECRERSENGLVASVAVLEDAGATVGSSTVVNGSPVDELAEEVARVEARESIVMTRPHIVAEFFHVDWSSQARRKLGVPVLHLLEHETFAEQSEGPGITGL